MVIIPAFLLLALAGVGLNESIAAVQTSNKAPQDNRERGQRTLSVNGVPYSVDVNISAGAAGDEALANGIYIFHLKCSADLFCSFERITLNECTAGKGGEPAFSTRVDSWFTSSGLLAVTQKSNSEIELTVYQAFGNQLPAKVTLSFASKGVLFKKLTGFRTSGFVDLRFWPNTKTGIEYEPVKIDRKKPLDCPVLLRGLNP
jgi:hypothetical protein